MGLVRHKLFRVDDAVTIPDYVAIGLLAVCYDWRAVQGRMPPNAKASNNDNKRDA